MTDLPMETAIGMIIVVVAGLSLVPVGGSDNRNRSLVFVQQELATLTSGCGYRCGRGGGWSYSVAWY